MPGLVQQTQQDRPVADIEELHKELRVSARRNRERGMTLRDSKEDVRKSKEIIRELLHSVSESNVVALCTCQQSKDFPFCDNTHAVFNKATNSNMAPLYVAIVDNRTCGECGSKSTEHGACCSTDNSHSNTDSNNSSDCNNTPTTRTLRSSSSRSLRKSTDKQLTTVTTTTCRCKDTTSHHSLTHSNSSHAIHTPSTPSTPDSTPTDTTPTKITPTKTEITTASTPTTNKPTDNTPTETNKVNDNVIIPNGNCITKEEDKNQEKDYDEKTDATINSPIYKPSSIKDPVNQKNIISKAVVSVHNTREDLWMIIKGNVYDITDYVQYHPGGVRALVKFAGKDGTENVQYHSSKMLEILNNNYFIGKLPKEEGGGGGCTIC